MGTSFLEIEHKYIVEPSFDRQAFLQKLDALSPLKTTEVLVEDTYYVLSAAPGFVYRHRYDRELEQLTVKSVEDSPEVRLEVNLNLAHGEKSQQEAITAFLGSLGVKWKHRLSKDVAVAYFKDCEIVHYRAKCGNRELACVEFEAVDCKTLEEALPVLNRYETLLGFSNVKKEERSLFELLLLKDAPEDVKAMFRK